MASGLARRRAAKAARRKAVLAERRRLAGPPGALSQAVQARRLASFPLRDCLLQEALFENGAGMLVLTRDIGAGRVAAVTFLLDTFCLGVKDVAFLEAAEPSMIDELVETMDAAVPFSPVDPAYARKLLRELVAWSRSLGIEPHRDYAAAELLFGEVRADDSDASFSFGADGRPRYIPGPGESPAQVRRRIAQLRRRLGEQAVAEVLGAGEDDPPEEDLPGDNLLDDDPSRRHRHARL